MFDELDTMNEDSRQLDFHDSTTWYARPGTDNDTSSGRTSPTRVTLAVASALADGSNEAVVRMWLIVSPILLVIGIVGNSLILATMTRKAMSGTSTYIYLVAMAALDIGALLTGLVPDWLEGASMVTLKTLHPVMCKLIKFLPFSFVDASILVRCLFTVDRCVAVCYPFYSGLYCGRIIAARAYVIVSVIVSCAFNFHAFFTRGAQYETVTELVSTLAKNDSSTTASSINVTSTVLVSNCGTPTPSYKHFDSFIRPWATLAFASVIPFAIIAIANAMIIYSLVRRRRRFTRVKRQNVVAAIVRVTTGKTIRSVHLEPVDHLPQVTFMCLATSGMFLLCTAPSIILLVGKVNWSLPKGANKSYEISKAVNNLVFYVIFAGNFFLYCLTAERFRSTLRSVCFPLLPTSPSQSNSSSTGHRRFSPGNLSMTSSTFSSSFRNNSVV